MFSQATVDRLNHQINLEMYSSHLYLQMSCWCAYKTLDSCALFLSQHADEEMTHMHRLLTYVQEGGALVVLGGVDAPSSQFDSIVDLFEKVYKHELLMTRRIEDLVHFVVAETDRPTRQFLQWYVTEQQQEVLLFEGILDKIKEMDRQGKGMFFIDAELENIAATTSEEISLMK